jgi:membrane-bound lytic murein transglycosylase B
MKEILSSLFLQEINAGLSFLMNAKRLKIISIALLIFSFFSIQPAYASQYNAQFVQWLHQFYTEAEHEGIRRETIDRSLGHLVSPDEKVLEKAQYQPEFTLTIWEYLDPRVNSITISRGQELSRIYNSVLSDIEDHFGVNKNILLAIWSMETSYGAILEKKDRFYYVPHALATLAFGDPKRSKFGKQQLLAALKILDAGDISQSDMLGSWAGAMGHTQFIPTSYLAYGYDWDHDGKRDIWHSVPDALATAANLLQKNGWKLGNTWGYEVYAPKDGFTYAGMTKTLEEWQHLGFSRPNKTPFPRPGERAELKYIAGEEGPAYLMTRNFFVIKRYNNSDFYALAVGQLADRLAGFGGMVQQWPRPAGSLNIDQKFELQTLLKKGGFYDGEIDGYLGAGSQEAIKEFQRKTNQAVTGNPSTALLQSLRKNIN